MYTYFSNIITVIGSGAGLVPVQGIIVHPLILNSEKALFLFRPKINNVECCIYLYCRRTWMSVINCDVALVGKLRRYRERNGLI